MSLRVVLIQSDMKTAQPLARYFTRRGDDVWQSWELGQGWALVEQVKPDLILMDLHFANSEWITFLRRVRQAAPNVKIIMTNKYPDLQRELLAREQNVQVFLRQPFSPRWIDQAMQRLDEGTAAESLPGHSEKTTPVNKAEPGQKAAGKPVARKPAAGRSAAGKATRQATSAGQPLLVRVPMRVKITLPYLLLALLFALASAYVVSQVVLESVQHRFANQLIETGKQSTDWMVREENRLLKTLRLVANTEGMAEAIQRQDAEALRALVLPIAANAGEEAVEVLGPDGASLLSLRKPSGGGVEDYVSTRGEDAFAAWDFVRRVTAGEVDAAGDKYAGLGLAPWGQFFYVSGPIHDGSGRLAGVVLVGKSLTTLVRQMGQETLCEVTLYDTNGQPLASTLYTPVESFPLAAAQVERALGGQDYSAFSRDLMVSTIDYAELIGPWEARGGADLGVLGISLAKAFLVRTSSVTRVEIFILVAASILLVLMIGVFLANRITRPLLRLVSASGQVAQGNLEVKVDASGDDEVAVLAQSFNYMVAGLQEGSIYRDLLGRTVSPEVREQLRQTFTSGDLKLEGQQAVATVLMCDIRGFTPISEAADPATVFQWLNEYFAQIVPIVAAHGGVVNKFDGDAMLAFFGILPRLLEPEQSASVACQVALEMLQAIDRLNEQRAERGEPLLVTGIGVNTGLVIAGGLGTADRLHYTIIGDTVNTTQRIEALTRSLMDSSGVLIGQATYAALGGAVDDFNLLPMGQYNVKGKSEPISVYRLLPNGMSLPVGAQPLDQEQQGLPQQGLPQQGLHQQGAAYEAERETEGA